MERERRLVQERDLEQGQEEMYEREREELELRLDQEQEEMYEREKERERDLEQGQEEVYERERALSFIHLRMKGESHWLFNGCYFHHS